MPNFDWFELLRPLFLLFCAAFSPKPIAVILAFLAGYGIHLVMSDYREELRKAYGEIAKEGE